jgi:3-hydroxybutyryl-CoA dehydratase
MIKDFYLNQEFSLEFEVNEDLIDKFIYLSKDNNPLHIDENYAKSKGYKSKVVHGNIQNCFISFFVGECLPTKEVILLSNSINYVSAVYNNQKIFFNSKVIRIHNSVNLVEFKFMFENVNAEKLSFGKIKIKIL